MRNRILSVILIFSILSTGGQTVWAAQKEVPAAPEQQASQQMGPSALPAQTEASATPQPIQSTQPTMSAVLATPAVPTMSAVPATPEAPTTSEAPTMLALPTIPVPTATASPKRMPDAKWRKNNKTGSAGVLTGRSVIVSIYIDDKNSKWTKAAKSRAARKLNLAGAYIRKQAKKYGKKVDLVTDINQYPDICYSYTSGMKITDSNRKQYQLYKDMKKFIDQNIDLTALREKYETDSIGFVFHLNKEGVSSTVVHYMEDKTKYFYECSTLFSKCDGKPEGASTYAHEMLHMFGARDLYEVSYIDGVTASLVLHTASKYPTEIMLTTYTRKGKQLPYRITNQISRVTAYFLGWKKKIPEEKRYAMPKVTKKRRGCFWDWIS